MADPGALSVGLVVGCLGRGGGTEGQAFALAAALAVRGHRVTVYCAEDDGAPEGVRVHRCLPRARGAAGVLLQARAASRLPLHRHDVSQSFVRVPGAQVHRAGGGAHAAWLRARGGWARPVDRATLWAEARAVASARLVLCNSNLSAADVRAAHGLPAERVRVVRNGVDLSRFRPDEARRAAARQVWGVPAGGRVALFVGHGFRRKGLDVAAAAFARVAGPRDRLVVMGRDARARRRLAAVAGEVGDRLVDLGARTDPERWMPGADAVILPTRYDPSANSTLEALACGVPAVTSGRDGAAEILPDPRLVVSDPADVAGFARALDHAWSAAAPERWRMAAEGWPVSRIGEAVEAIYRELRHV